LVTKERAGFQSAVSNQVSMETDVLPTVSSGPVSTQSGFKLALACTRRKGTPGGFRAMRGAGARIGSFLAGAGCCLLSERIEPLVLDCTPSSRWRRRKPVRFLYQESNRPL
jgi:hypothetical protein